jgi:hypothetical protein
MPRLSPYPRVHIPATRIDAFEGHTRVRINVMDNGNGVPSDGFHSLNGALLTIDHVRFSIDSCSCFEMLLEGSAETLGVGVTHFGCNALNGDHRGGEAMACGPHASANHRFRQLTHIPYALLSITCVWF